MKSKIMLPVLALAMSVSACATQQGNVEVGRTVGAIAGGVVGSTFGEGSGKIAATIGGALIGSWIGSDVARNMTTSDRRYYDRAESVAYSAPIGDEIQWNNPQTGATGAIIPTRDGTSSNGYYCREFQQTITIGGRTEQAFGTACQMPDGSWKIVGN